MTRTTHRYEIRFPALEPHRTQQDEAWFVMSSPGGERRIRFHDYAAIYEHPGLYEQLFYDRLKCASPTRVAALLERAVRASGEAFSELRCLDLGAGNGMMGEELQRTGVARVVGVDILPEARDAALRDRPGVYDAYHVADLTEPQPALLDELREWRFDCLTTVAALGFGDIPTAAFQQALGLVEEGGWIAFNVKETFLRESDAAGFARLVRELLFAEGVQLHYIERYRHRLSIDGRPLYYYAIVARKRRGDAPPPEPDLLQLLWEAGHALQAMSRRMERTLGISGPQRLVLREVVRRPGIVSGELAGILGIHPSTVTGLVDGLVGAELVERRRDELDRRVVQLVATPAGAALLQRDARTIESVVRQTAHQLPDEQRRVVAAFLHEVSTALRAAAEAEE
jgi:DNA-binding MarR family transcriptional regulator/predicted TPR repeat methyltransferase